MANRVTSSEQSQSADSISYLTQQEAAEINETLVGPLGFSLDQLMELTGLSVATAIAEVYRSSEYSRVLVICGPGNNGGDGLVAVRHLHHFGYKPFVCYPNCTPKPLHSGLVKQLESLAVPFLSVEDLPIDLSDDFDILVDAIFGFSFHGTPRAPFDDLIQRLALLQHHDRTHWRSSAIVSVDIPSGWHVEEGDISGVGIKPNMLVSLMAPKLCAKHFCGSHHFLGGRFVPPSIMEKYKLQLPQYTGTSICVRIGKATQVHVTAHKENFISPEFQESVGVDPFDQFQNWFNHAVTMGLKEPNAMALSTAGKDGKPSSRMISLKGVSKDGFVWYSNCKSRKARELSENPHASLLFYWDGLHRQVRVEGVVEKVSDEESQQYFHCSSQGSQIGAIVSEQTAPGQNVLLQEHKKFEAKFSDRSLFPKPQNWEAYKLKPEYFEFWQGDESRLHNRLRYFPEVIGGKHVWKIDHLVP